MNKRQAMSIAKVLKSAKKVTVRPFLEIEKFGSHKCVQIFVDGKLYTEMSESKFSFVKTAMKLV